MKLFKKINSKNLTVFCTIAEFLSIYFIIHNLLLHKPHFKNHILFVITFGIGIFLFLIKKGLFSKILEINFWGTLSKFSYSIFITHAVVLNSIKETFWKHNHELIVAHPYTNITITLFLVLAFGIITYYLIEVPAIRYFSKK